MGQCSTTRTFLAVRSIVFGEWDFSRASVLLLQAPNTNDAVKDFHLRCSVCMRRVLAADGGRTVVTILIVVASFFRIRDRLGARSPRYHGRHASRQGQAGAVAQEAERLIISWLPHWTWSPASGSSGMRTDEIQNPYRRERRPCKAQVHRRMAPWLHPHDCRIAGNRWLLAGCSL